MKIIDQGKSLKETRAQIEKTLQQIWASDPNAAGAEKCQFIGDCGSPLAIHLMWALVTQLNSIVKLPIYDYLLTFGALFDAGRWRSNAA